MGNTKSTDITNKTDITNIDLIKKKYDDADIDDMMVKFVEYLSNLNKSIGETREEVNTIMTEVYQIAKYISYSAEEDRRNTTECRGQFGNMETSTEYDYDDDNKELVGFIKHVNNILAILENYTDDFYAIVATKDESHLIRNIRLICEKIHEGNESLEAQGKAITKLSDTMHDVSKEVDILLKVQDISERMKRGERPTKVEQLLLMVNLNIASRDADIIYEKKEKGEPLREMEQKMIETFTYKETDDFPGVSLDKLKELQKETLKTIKEG